MDFVKMKTIKYLSGILLAILVICVVEAKRDYSIEILDFHVNATRSELFAQSIKTSFSTEQITAEFILAQPVSEITAKFKVDIVSPGKAPFNMLQLEGNICHCLKFGCRSNFLAALFKEVFRTSNFPKTCHLLANKKYYIRNYTARAEDYPPYTPKVMWQIIMDIALDKSSAMIWYIRGRNYKL